MRTTEKVAETLVQATHASPDPVYYGMGWVLGFVVIVIALARPIMSMARMYQANKASGARDGADTALYNQLKEQIEVNSKDIRTLIEERNKYHEESLNLKIRVGQLEEAEKAVARMKEKLDFKDELLRKRDEENRRLMMEIIDLKDRLHALELFMAGDKAKFCANCERVG